jgi:Tfp pilus assembly protein PilF
MSSGSQSKPSRQLQQTIEKGFAALGAGDQQLAADLCRTALAERPEMARAHYLAAVIALEGGDRNMAQQALETVVRLNDTHSAAWAQLARLFVTSGEFVKAEGCLINAVNTEQGNPAVLDLIGTVFRLAGNLEASRQWHQKAVAKDDQHVPFLINLANSHLYHGEQQAAERILRNCIDIQPNNPQVHWMLSGTYTAMSMQHVNEMRTLLESELHPRSIAYFEYAIGKECEDQQDWQSAGDAFERGAAARRKTVAYDEAAEIELFATAEQLFTKDWLDKQQAGPDNSAPIFIVGEPRTGTTLLDRIIGAHSAVASAGELRHFGYALRQVTRAHEPRQFTAGLLRSAASADLAAIGNAYLVSISGLCDAPRISDKLPFNYLYLPLIVAALPGAKILHMTRDPMDTCLAIYKQNFADAYLYSYDQQELARHYVRYAHLMNIWRERLPGRFLDVSYEGLVSNTEIVARQVCDYLDLPWEENCLRYYGDQGTVTTASAAQVRQPAHTRSIGRWRRYENQLGLMRRTLQEQGVPVDDH